MSAQVPEVVIVAALRTPIGSFMGGLAPLGAPQLAAPVLRQLLADTGVAPQEVDQVLLGQVLAGGQGQNPARQAAVAAGLPYTSCTALGVNMVCGSGLRSVALGAQAILTRDSEVVLAGGMESMSSARHTAFLRAASKFGDQALEDSLLKDGLTDAFHDYHMGVTAENVAKKYSLSREEQDAFAARSQQKAGKAIAAGEFKAEIVPVVIASRKGEVTVSEDEFPRPDTTVESLAKLRPAFLKDGTGTVTAGNSSGINDGAAAVLLMSGEEAARRNLGPGLGKVVSWACAGVEPALMGTGPVPAVRKALEKAKWSLEEVDVFELNEAFASQSLAVVRELGVAEEKVNLAGGSIALGHPIGASGARVLVTLLHLMKRNNYKKGVVSLCIGGGMGIAMCIQVA